LLMIMLPSCATIHETTSSQPKMTLKEAMAAMNEAVKASMQDHFWGNVKVVKNIDISEYGITLINSDNTKRYYAFSDIIDPSVGENSFNHVFFVKFKQDLTDNFIEFTNAQSAIMFANALYYVKHTDIKQERAKEREDSRRRAQETAAEEQKERDQKQAESLRLKQKAAMEAEAATAKDESSPEATPEKRKSRPRPAAAKKTAGEPAPRQPEGGAPPVPTLPAGGAVSGN
jgi:hypothetical protein